MRWMIAADSSCDLKQMDTGSPDILYDSVPFVITADSRQFVDEVDLDVPELVSAFEASSSSSSACPSPLSWQELFQKADRVIALTISGRLSGSFNSAMVGKAMALEADPNKKIEVIDSLATGPKLVLLAQHALRQIQDQMSFEAVCASCRDLASSARTVFTLNSFHNLVQNGRVSKIAGFIAGKLGIRVIGVGSREGEIQLKDLMRGEQRTLKKIVKDLEDNGYDGGEMAVSHCLNESLALTLKEMILSRWSQAKVAILPTRGLDSYYAERGGLIISYPVSASGV